jgi:SAM-dependent methyltransferase
MVTETAYESINLGVLRHIGTSMSVLDVGCGRGLLGESIRRQGNSVVGIERDPQQASAARARLDRVLQMDIVTDPLPEDLGKFDRIVFADVLEHVPDPWAVLARFKVHLKSDGQMILSIPNVACWSIRFGLLFGRFEYKDYGILDRTHLRFFTLRGARRLVAESGLHLEEVDVQPYLVAPVFGAVRKLLMGRRQISVADFNQSAFQSPAFRFYQRYVFPVERLTARLWKRLLAWQFILVAKA